MNEAALKAEWLDFAKRLRPIGMGIFGGSAVKIAEQEDIRMNRPDVAGSNTEQFEGCHRDDGRRFDCRGQSYRALLFREFVLGRGQSDKFRNSMVDPEMKHKRLGARTIFATTKGLKGAFGDNLRQWMRDHEQYEDSPTLDPKEVCERAQSESYMFYQHLSWDAHPSIQTLQSLL